MRFRHPDGSTVHLAYCTNVHPAEDLEGVIAQLDGCSALVRKELKSRSSASASGSRTPWPTASPTRSSPSAASSPPSTATAWKSSP